MSNAALTESSERFFGPRRAFAGVSAPLTWKEVHDRPKPQDFTIDTIETRVKKVGDLWAKLRAHKGTDLLAAIDKLRK